MGLPPSTPGVTVKVADVAVLETETTLGMDGPTAETWDGLSIRTVDVNVKTRNK